MHLLDGWQSCVCMTTVTTTLLAFERGREQCFLYLGSGSQTLVYYRLSVCVPEIPVEILISNVMILGCEAFGRPLGFKCGALINGISTLIRERRACFSFLFFSHVRTQ